jgi:hypothetical protein
MEAFRIVLIGAAALLLTADLGGQSTTATLLPPEAKVIETVDLRVNRSTDRVLALWMLHPKRVVRSESGSLGCADWVYGDHWYGPARLSLLDLTNKRLINTVEIRGMYEGANETDHSFPIPFLVGNGSYYVPKVTENKEGPPIILNLRDLTGEGIAGQFVLFEYEACAISLTTVVGYSRRSDLVVQYGVETIIGSGKPTVVPWVEQVFGAKPIRPGHWDFTWQPGHGVDGGIHERVSFDTSRQVFVRK